MCEHEDIFWGENGQKAATGGRLNPERSEQEAPFILLLLLLLMLMLLLVILLLFCYIVSISILPIINFLLGFAEPFLGRGSPFCRPGGWRAAPRPGQPHGEGALGSGRAKKIEPDKLILVAFVI